MDRFAIDVHPKTLAARLVARMMGCGSWAPDQAIARLGRAPILIHRNTTTIVRELDFRAQWGLKPAWAADDHPRTCLVDIDSAHKNGLFREPLVRRRCLVPMTAYFPAGESAQPALSVGEPMRMVAGIYNVDATNSGSPISFALLTSARRRERGELVFVAADDVNSWLNPDDLAEPTSPIMTLPALI